MLKEKFSKTNMCLECKRVFDKDTNNKNFLSFSNHLKTLHNMSNEDYYRKYFLKDGEGICLCGCNEKTNFHKGRYLKFFSNHKNHSHFSRSYCFNHRTHCDAYSQRRQSTSFQREALFLEHGYHFCIQHLYVALQRNDLLCIDCFL